MDEYHVVSFSGGKDSTAMLLMMLERGMRVDEVVFTDTGMEFPGIYDHLRCVEKHMDTPITRLRAEHSFEHYMFEYVRMKGKHAGVAGYGWPRPRARWCTGYLKTKLIDRYFSDLAKTHRVIHYIGIAADEAHRCRDKRYPLVDWGVTEAEALKYCYAQGFDWGGLYEKFRRVSCWCCPLQPLPELRTLRREFPDLWERLRDMDRRAWNSFRIGTSVEQLEWRFAWEDAQRTIFDELDDEKR